MPKSLAISPKSIFWLGCTMMFAMVFLNIVIIDDSYITFRVVDNAVNGWGLGWNVDERVQAYTNPLWMLIHLPLYALVPNIYWVTIALSVIFGVMTVVKLLQLAPGLSEHQKLFLVVAPLVGARIFRNYVVCGLENPLSFLLFAYLLVELFAGRRGFSYYRFSFVASLAVITRFDNVVMLAPLWACLTLSYRREISLGRLLLSFSPIILWHGFSLFYYGFFFPNTKYAKLHMGVPLIEYIGQGLLYVLNLFKTDMLAGITILAAMLLALKRGMRAAALMLDAKQEDTRLFLLGAGFLLHFAYVISVGGDFMPGRFFSTTYVVALGILVLHFARMDAKALRYVLGTFIAIMAFNHLLLQPNLPDRRLEAPNHGIDDQHDYYAPLGHMLSDPDHVLRVQPNHPRIDAMLRIREKTGTQFIINVTTINGLKFYYGGPYVIVLDLMGLGDALMARLPVSHDQPWRIGHPIRELPEGYLIARGTGDLSSMNPSLASYYEKLRLVISGDLLDTERLVAILGFQLGWYDGWLQEYIDSKAQNEQ